MATVSWPGFTSFRSALAQLACADVEPAVVFLVEPQAAASATMRSASPANVSFLMPPPP